MELTGSLLTCPRLFPVGAVASHAPDQASARKKKKGHMLVAFHSSVKKSGAFRGGHLTCKMAVPRTPSATQSIAHAMQWRFVVRASIGLTVDAHCLWLLVLAKSSIGVEATWLLDNPFSLSWPLSCSCHAPWVRACLVCGLPRFSQCRSEPTWIWYMELYAMLCAGICIQRRDGRVFSWREGVRCLEGLAGMFALRCSDLWFSVFPCSEEFPCITSSKEDKSPQKEANRNLAGSFKLPI